MFSRSVCKNIHRHIVRAALETEMNKFFAVALLVAGAMTFAVSGPARAQNEEPAPAAPVAAPAPAVAPANPDCAAKASEKKLAGAALNSFMKKCMRDTATAGCSVAAEEKKLKGAAKASFTKKCVKDAIIAQ